MEVGAKKESTRHLIFPYKEFKTGITKFHITNTQLYIANETLDNKYNARFKM